MLDMHCRPSDLVGINDTYAAFCFDEACAFIISKLNDKEEPIIRNESTERHRSRPSDVYGKFNKE